jgi:hypothetical protein
MLTPTEFNQIITAVAKSASILVTPDEKKDAIVSVNAVVDILKSFTDGFVKVTRTPASNGGFDYSIEYDRSKR